MGFKIIFSIKPEIIVCGSILGFNKRLTPKTKIWGVGFHNKEDITIVKNKNLFYAVRGRLTLNKLNLTSSIGLGDPGLLLSIFFKPITKKKYDICIISHYIDYKWFKKNYGNQYFIIHMGNNNIEEIANSINKCNFIFSSSLHGIIFSHSLGIPAVHLEHKMLNSKNNFKFKDYYSILDIPYIKENVNSENLDIIVKKYEKNRLAYLPSNKIIKQIQENLLFSFPYQNMNNVICTFVKNEIKNINNWCKYHLNLGFDNIYIYNYNDNSTNYIGDYIDDKIKNKVHILNLNNKKLEKKKVYLKFYNLFKFNFKWCVFIDIDKFIILSKWNHISQFLNEPIYKNTTSIIFKWFLNKKNYLMESSYKQSITKIKTKKTITNFFECQKNHIIKNGLNGIYFQSVKYLKDNSQISLELYQYDKNNLSDAEILFKSNYDGISYINNYITKN